MIGLDTIFSSVCELLGKWLDYLIAKVGATSDPNVLRKADAKTTAARQAKARIEVATGDTQAITVTTDDVIAPAPGPAQDEGEVAAMNAEIAKKDTKAMKQRLEGLLAYPLFLCALCVLCGSMAAGCRTAPPPAIPPALTWEVKVLAIDGQDYIAVPKAVYSRMLDRLIYLRELETQGRIRQE